MTVAHSDRTRSTPNRASEILVCDYCGGRIEEPAKAMFLWKVARRFAEDPDLSVTSTVLAHKACDARQPKDPSDYWMELYMLRDPRVALREVARTANTHWFTGAQLQRIADVAWAIAIGIEREAAGL